VPRARAGRYLLRMRTAAALILALAGAAVVGVLLLRPHPAPESEGPVRAPPPATGEDVRAPTEWATLVVRVHAVDGTVPRGTRAGYERDGLRTLEPVDASGRRTFTNLAPGEVLVVAAAPGYAEAVQRRPLVGGVPTTVTLRLHPE
jgi:hypothetical protein